MEKPAAFSAAYVDWKVIKTRSAVQIVFEVPVEAAGHAYNVLSGMPTFGTEKRFAIARLQDESE